MSKKYIHRIGCIVLAFLIIFTCTSCDFKTELESFDAQYPDYINYNNYNQQTNFDGGQMDYLNGTLAYAPYVYNIHTFTVDGESQSLSGIQAPFQLTENNGIVYRKNATLYFRDSNGKDHLIAKNIYKFIAWHQYIVYQTMPNSNYIQNLCLFDTTALTNIVVQEDVDVFAVNDQYIFTVFLNFDLHRISYDDLKIENITKLDIDSLPYTLNVTDDTLVMSSGGDGFRAWDLHTWESRDFVFPYAWYHDMAFVCEGEYIYYSFSGTIQDGSFNYFDENHEHNGTWKMNLYTGEEERILEEIYTELYCFDRSRLYGVKLSNGFQKIELISDSLN